ncbi:MAG: endolytic transglycosylase MltG [Bacteroidota bacterium]
MSKKSKKKHLFLKVFVLIFIVALVITAYYFYLVYTRIYKPNVSIEGASSFYLKIPTGSNYDDVLNILEQNNLLINKESFGWVAEQKKYFDKVKPGRYKIKNQMSNNALVNILRSGEQEPVNVVFHLIRSKEQLAGKVAEYIECDSVELNHLFKDPQVAEKYGFNQVTFFTMFIPNSYEFYWNTSGNEFIERMAKEYKYFWTDNRRSKAKDLGLSQSEVSILASIVQEETIKIDEMPKVAGVYINRLKKGMFLQADPTVKFALGDYTIKRVLKKHLEIDSKYNTYKYAGLPPGPISLPTTISINAVLNYYKSDYLFFCAKEDFSGYHNFAKTLNQHNINARNYQAALNKRKIMN